MEVYSIDITSWTASFRYPNLISGIQPSLEVPPISTVLGLINAAAGRYLKHTDLTLGYYFRYAAKATDLETIYMIDSNKGRPTNNAKSNIIRREFLFENFLRIYTVDPRIAAYFQSPVYPLVLGRMNDLASVANSKICKKEVLPVTNADRIKGQIIPFQGNFLPGTIQALPKYFTDTIPRRNIGTEAFSILNHRSKVESRLSAFRDDVNGEEVDIYLHSLTFAPSVYTS